MAGKRLCHQTVLAIEEIFFNRDIGTREDAILLLKEINPDMPEHLDSCDNCTRALDAQLFCVEAYASLPA